VHKDGWGGGSTDSRKEELGRESMWAPVVKLTHAMQMVRLEGAKKSAARDETRQSYYLTRGGSTMLFTNRTQQIELKNQ